MGISENGKKSNREASARWAAENPEKVRFSLAKWRAKNPEKVKEYAAKWASENPEKKREHAKRWAVKNPEKYLLAAAKRRAKRQNLTFSLTAEDIVIPDKCPVLGTRFERGTPFAASLDRVIPSLGYVSGNVKVISRRANVIKRDATLEELEAITHWLRQVKK